MDQETINNYKKAGKIAAEVLNYGKTLIKKDALIVETIDKIESKIVQLGAKPAFPAQISMNECAAHFCPEQEDKTTFTDQLVSLDVGVHVNGCIGDNALTVDLSEKYTELVKASREAVNNAIKIVQIGTTLSEIGKTIQETIESYGYKPIRNLSGHGLGNYNIHSEPQIPNFDTKDKTELKKYQAIAIEPFANLAQGSGMIQEQGKATVFAQTAKKSVRTGFVRNILKEIETYEGLPFTTRWLTKKFSPPQVNFTLTQLNQLNIIKSYPPLVEKNFQPVSQAEHSLLIDDKVIILTKWE